MTVFINGPFGVGKMSVAKLLVQKIPNATLYDPEVIGSILQGLLGPFKRVADFQDYALWRALFVGGARLLRKASARTLVIPIAVWRRDLFDLVISGFRRVDDDLWCFRLTAARDVLMDRIWSDAGDKRAYGWRMSHVDICLRASRDPAFGTEISKNGRTPVEVADRILKSFTTPTV